MNKARRYYLISRKDAKSQKDFLRLLNLASLLPMVIGIARKKIKLNLLQKTKKKNTIENNITENPLILAAASADWGIQNQKTQLKTI
jgi:hypothetical protein